MKNRTWLLLLVVLLVCIAGLRLLSGRSDWVETYYRQGLYLLWSEAALSFTGLFPFSLFEWIVTGIFLLAGAVLVRGILAFIRKKRSLWAGLTWMLLRLSAGAAALYLWFLLSWGLNYYGPPWEGGFEGDGEPLDPSRFRVVSRWMDHHIRSIDIDSAAEEVERARGAALAALDAYLSSRGKAIPDEPVRIKHFIFDYPMEATRTLGIISPLTLELHLSKGLFPEEIPFLAAHEAAHIRGYASETEANFLAFEACMQSGHDLARFSAFYLIFPYLAAGLPKEEQIALYRGRPEAVKALSLRISRREEPFEGTLWYRVSRTAYDLYLKSNAVKEGIRSYSRVGAWIARTRYAEAEAFLERME